LLGDKLTAFSPHTIGVPFQTEKGTMQVVKQLFDLGELFSIAVDFEKVEIAFKETFIKENGYRGNEFSEEQVLQDTINICYDLLQLRVRGGTPTVNTNYLEDGVRRLQSHLVQDNFRTDNEAKIAASKVFCIANRLLKEKPIDFDEERFTPDAVGILEDILLSSPYEKLNRLKAVLPEAFYYIWKGIED